MLGRILLAGALAAALSVPAKAKDLLGARVVAGASTEDKRAAALGFGADATVDYTTADWRDALRACTPDGLNLVYDPVGGDLSEPAFRSLSPGGRFLVVGFAAGAIPKLPLNLALLKRSSLVGVDWGGEIRANPQLNVELMRTLFDLVQSGHLHPASVVTRDMADLPAALNEQLAGRIVGKLVMVNPAAAGV